MSIPTECAAVLDELLEASGFATYSQLIHAAGLERGFGDERALRKVITDLRKALRPEGIEVIDMYGLGYGIPVSDLEQARAWRVA